ncbi:putative TPR repeat-containing protein [Frankia sp. AiPs1]|uniref:tetratricopeptide repeat protein n=1 Tax=Frankia sp. AiPa1 TaxID=573492 RepID=UPI00202ACDC9|nr:tetratricopeptide repeat protein [Frankia sp. AiPa1]MCL9760254.1 tetratricopeptide repeat protein [Frankia sp. AiPa1]
MATPPQEVLRRLQDGESLADIRRADLPVAWVPMLEVCAVARVFDADVFHQVLVPAAAALRPNGRGEGLPSLDDLRRRQLVAARPRSPERFRIAEDDRRHFLRAWQNPAQNLERSRALRRLAQQLASRSDGQDQIFYDILADPAEAVRRFTDTFARAHRLRDFPGMQDLLDLVGDPDYLALAGSDLTAAVLDRTAFLRTQRHWSDDYRRSAQYFPHFPEPELERRVADLLDRKGPRTWQIQGPGGTGKTILMQWLVARRCAEDEIDIPCARLDLDALNPAVLGRYPWLALLLIAEQFDRRWPQPAFGKLMDQHGELVAFTARHVPNRAHALTSGPLLTEEPPPSVREDFVRSFNAAAYGRPALVVVDTLEELLAGAGSEVSRLLELLAGLQHDCPDLRIVLAGRADLRRRSESTAAMKAFPRLETIHLEAFSDERAAAYLTDVRGLERGPLVDRIVRRAKGLPFNLALFADLAATSPDLGLDAVTSEQNPILVYLRERILQRIDDKPVQTLLRFGAVPRRLSLQDATTVMRPVLAAALGLGPQDLSDAMLTDAWHRLRAYIGIEPWVTFAPGDIDRIIFHPNVRGPMRELVWTEPGYRQLHQDFAAYYEQQAIQDQGRRPEHLRESLYHRFQLGDQNAQRMWHEAVRRYQLAADLDALALIAGDVRGDDYLEENPDEPDDRNHGRGGALDPDDPVNRIPRRLPPGPTDLVGEPIVTLEVVAESWLYEAFAAVRRARRGEIERWSDARLALGRFDALDQKIAMARHQRGTRWLAQRRASKRGLAEVVRAALLSHDGQPADGAQRARRALRSTHDPLDRVELLDTLGACETAAAEWTRAEAAYSRALDACEKLLPEHHAAEPVAPAEFLPTSDWRPRAAEIRLALSSVYEAMGRFDTAVTCCEQAHEQAKAGGPRRRIMVELSLARLRLRRWEPSLAATIARSAEQDGASSNAQKAQAAQLRARAEYLLGHASDALASLDRADRHASGISEDSERCRNLAESRQLRGVVQGELLRLGDAADSFEQASALWNQLGFSAGHPEWRMLYATFLLRDVGDARQATQLLSGVTSPDRPNDPTSEIEVRTWLLAGQAEADAGNSQVALVTRADRFSAESKTAPYLAALAAARTVAITQTTAVILVSRLGEILPRLQPASAWGVALNELAACSSPPTTSGPEWRQLLRTLQAQSGLDDSRLEAGDANQDQALRSALLAQVRWLAGERRDVAGALDHALTVLAGAGDATLARWRWLRARALVGTAAPGQPPSAPILRHPHTEPLLHESLGSPLLRASAMGLVADAARAQQEPGYARLLLLKAVELQNRERLPSRWAAENLDRLARDDGPRPGTVAGQARGLYARLGRPAHTPQVRVLADREGEQPLHLTSPPGGHLSGVDILDREQLHRLLSDQPEEAVRAALRARLKGWGPRRGDAGRFARLESDDPMVHMVPWELAATDRFPALYRSLPGCGALLDVRWLQTVLNAATDVGQRASTGGPVARLVVDGVAGAHTQEALARLIPGYQPGDTLVSTAARAELDRLDRARGRHRPADVVVIRPPAEVELATARGHWTSGYDITAGYQQGGLRVHTPDALEVRRAGPPIRDAAILHLNARLRIAGDLPYLDLAGDGRRVRLQTQSPGSELRARDVVALLRSFPSGEEPILVLDPPFPGSETEIPWQLLLRNLFAAQVFQEAATPAIIASGLGRRTGITLVRELSRGLTSQESLLTIIDRVRRAEPDDTVAGRSTALFAAPSAISPP